MESSTVKGEKDLVVDSKIPADGSNAALRMPAAAFKDLPSSSNILEKLCAFTSQRETG